MASGEGVTTDSRTDLPVELWELVLGFLSRDEICTLACLNHVFLTCARNILYGTVEIPGLPSRTQGQLIQIKRNRRLGGHVKRLVVLSNAPHYLEFPQTFTFSLDLGGTLAPLFSPAILARRFSPEAYYILKATSRMTCLTSLRLDLNSVVYPYVGALLEFCSKTIVELHLSFRDQGLLLHRRAFPASVFCPNVRSLTVAVSLPHPMWAWPGSLATLGLVLARINRLVPDTLAELRIESWPGGRWGNNDGMANCRLDFRRLQKLSIFTVRDVEVHTPLGLESLISANTNLSKLYLSHTLRLDYQNVRWNPDLQHICMGGHMFYLHRSSLLPRLAQCSSLRSFKLYDQRFAWALQGSSVDLDAMFADIVRSLRNSTRSLEVLQVPAVTFDVRFLEIVFDTFRSLKDLNLVGLPYVEYVCFQQYISETRARTAPD